MYRRILSTVILCTVLLQAGAAGTDRNRDKSDDGFTTIVFDRAYSPVPYRIPAIAETRRGTLLAACDFRFSHTDVGWNNRNGARTMGAHGRTRSVSQGAMSRLRTPSARLSAIRASSPTARRTTC